MSVEFYRGSPGKFDSRTLSRKALSRWTGRIMFDYITGGPPPALLSLLLLSLLLICVLSLLLLLLLLLLFLLLLLGGLGVADSGDP